MSEPATLPHARATGAPKGRLTVGDYMGAPAGEAARAVRRAGLKPGLDRQLGYPPETVGRVVAQDPPAGETQQRGGIVTLYVAAPGPDEPAREASAEEQTREGQTVPHAGPADHQSIQTPPVTVSGSERAVRSRVCYVAASVAAPARTLVLRSPAVEAVYEPRDRPSSALRGELHRQVELDPDSIAADGDRAPGVEPLAASMREAFASPESAGRTGRIYPREPLALRLLCTWAWIRRRRARVLVCALLVCWLAFALGHRASNRGSPAPARARTVAATPTPRATPLHQTRPTRVPRRADRARKARPKRSGSVAPESQPPQAHAPVSATAPQAPSVAEPAHTPAPASSRGGPFSP